MSLTRREFLIASAGGFLMTAGARSISAQKPKHIIIAGAGLAGLSAAYELAGRGYRVTVVEGRDRVGGRIRTLREPFSDDLYVETGGELLGDGYKRMLGYADKFGLRYVRLADEVETGGSIAELQDGIGTTAYMKGRLYPRGSVLERHPYGLKDYEARVLPPTLYRTNVRLMQNEIRQQTKTLEDFDKMSLAAELRKRGVSARAVKLIDVALNYNSVGTVSTAGILNDGIKRRNAGDVPVRIIGGNDSVTEALADNARKKGAKFILSAKVKKVFHDEKGVRIAFENKDGGTETVTGDKFICTIPFSVLREVEFAPVLPPLKRRAINELDYTQNTKVYLQAKYAEWGKRSLGSSIWTDTPLERIFSSTARTGDENAIFTIWTDGAGSKTLEKMADDNRVAYARDYFEKILPFMKGSIEKTHTLSWSKDEFVRGTYAYLKVGQMRSVQPFIKTRIGNIHFAGEHTAETFPGMEGALESAERVVKEII